MAIAKLTSDDLKEPAREITVLVKLNETIQEVNDIQGAGTPGAGSFTDLEIDGALNHDGSTAGFYNTTPIAKQTGVAVTAEGIHAALVALGLIAA